jgi:hypothetical protein
LEEKATVEEAQEEAKEKEQAKITERVTRKLLPTMSSRLGTKLWVSGRERRESESHSVSRYKVARYYVQTPSETALLYLSILQPISRSTDFPLCSVWRYIPSDYPMCSTLPGDATHAYSLYYACRYYNRLSALPTVRSALSSDILQPTICCALLYLATLHSTIRFTMPVDCPLSRLSALPSDIKQPTVHYSVC